MHHGITKTERVLHEKVSGHPEYGRTNQQNLRINYQRQCANMDVEG